MKSYRTWFVFLFAFIAFMAVVPMAWAVNIPGGMTAAPVDDPEEEELPDPARRIFSSQLKNVAAAEKLDRIYHTGEVFLLDISEVHFVHQRNLIAQMEGQKFKITRRLSEFKPLLDRAMEDLNADSKDWRAFVADMNTKAQALKGEFGEEGDAAMALWAQNLTELEAFARAYLQSQNRYLNIYNDLVQYILQKSGRYYFDSDTGRLAFYNVDEYTIVAENIDRLTRITFNQQQTLKKIKPPEIP